MRFFSWVTQNGKMKNTDFYRNLEELVDMIEKEIQLPIVFFDEAYSSKRGVE